MRNQLYRYVPTKEHGILYGIGIYYDGRVRNPHNYPEDVVRKVLANLAEVDRKRRSDGAKKAAVTRKRRQAKMILQMATRIVEGRQTGPRSNCAICGRGLCDPESIQRGIGSECWQGVLSETEKLRDQRQRQGVIDGMPASATLQH